MKQSKILKTAVIGLGMGRNHARRFSEMEESELVGLADLDEARLKEWEHLVADSSHCYTDYREMLRKEKPDAVAVALPNFLHKPVTLDCLDAGAHVLCEKPMALNVEEAEAMKAKAVETGLQLGINLSYRKSIQALALKDLVDDGFLGEPYHAMSRWTRRNGFPGFGGWFGQKKMSGGGPLIDLGVHRLDLALWLMGCPNPVSASASAHRRVGVPRAENAGRQFDVEDLATGFIRLENGASMIFEISWGNHQAEAEEQYTRVIGTKGAVVQRNTDGHYTFTAEAHTDMSGHPVDPVVQQAGKKGLGAREQFLHQILDGKPVSPGMEDGLRIQRILDALYLSAEKGEEIKIAVPADARTHPAR